jgi:predicted O-methyltransferase YrrM
MTDTVFDRTMRAIHGTNVYAGFVPVMPLDLQGWNQQHQTLRAAADTATIIIDVGTWKGASTIGLAQRMQTRGVDGCVIGVDTFLGSPEHVLQGSRHAGLVPNSHGRLMLYEQFLTNVVRSGVQHLVVPLPQTSDNAAAILATLRIKADAIHVDAAHDYDSVLRDARAYWRLLAPGGTMIGDDYHPSWPGVMKGADEFAAEVGLPLENIPPKWIIRKR